jgi:hypothetical protein
MHTFAPPAGEEIKRIISKKEEENSQKEQPRI